MPDDTAPQPFICPECGSTEATIESMVSTRFDLTNPDPWSRVLQTIDCAQCGFTIPAHLGERWNGFIEEAQHEWRQEYRKWSDNKRRAGFRLSLTRQTSTRLTRYAPNFAVLDQCEGT